MDIKVLSVEKSPILLGFCYGGIIVNIVCFSVPSWRCKRFWLQRRELNVVWPVKHSVTLVKEHKREKGKMSVSSFENYFLKGILKRLLHSRSAHLHKRWKKSRKCQILWAHSSERRVSMQRRNILGKMPDLHEVPIQRGFKRIMCTLVSIKECMALLSIACYQTYCPTRYAAQNFSEPFGGFSAGLFSHVCQHC